MPDPKIERTGNTKSTDTSEYEITYPDNSKEKKWSNSYHDWDKELEDQEMQRRANESWENKNKGK